MSWLISDSSNANSTGHLSTYDGNLYYNQDSWRLCKNIMWVGPESQKWQQSFDLDSFYSTDKDFGFNKKFNGFTFNTSAEMPSISQDQGSLPNEQESYKNISGEVTFSKDFTSSSVKRVTFYQVYSFTADVDGTVKVINSESYVGISKNGTLVYSSSYSSGDDISIASSGLVTIEYDILEIQTKTRSGYNLTDATSSVTRLPKINGLPYKGTTVRTPSYSSSYDFISPNERHRKSGHFVVTKDGTISVKCALQSLTTYINSYDNYQQINPTVTIKKNGNVVASYSNPNETKSYTTNIAVSAGDLIDVAVSDIFTQNSYYELDYNYEVTDKCYLTGDKDETSFTMYKSSYNSSNTPAYDMAFIVSESGSLEWSYNDVRSENTSVSNDGILNIFVNSERKVRADSDNVTSSGSISLSVGDVVLIRYCTHSCSVGNKDEYVYVERGWDTPGGQCTISFSGSAVPAAFNHTLSWREYCKLILAEARLWVDDNSLADYALPVAIIDDAGDLEKINQFYTELSDSRVYADLWASVNTLTNLNLYYVKCFNVDMNGSPITTSLFEEKSITQVRIKDARDGIKAFKNTTKKINSLELVNISGDWTEAFRNSVSNGVSIGKFTTSGLTSAKDMFRGCEIRGTWNLDEDKLNAFFNDTYNKWAAGEYNFRSAFVGSYHSGTIPESFMSAESQFACNWDPATLIQKVAST